MSLSGPPARQTFSFQYSVNRGLAWVTRGSCRLILPEVAARRRAGRVGPRLEFNVRNRRTLIYRNATGLEDGLVREPDALTWPSRNRNFQISGTGISGPRG
jgi:hypothetical protein